jgi:hypothetical protein
MAEFKGIPIATTGVRSGEKYQTPQGFTAIRDGIKVQGEAVPSPVGLKPTWLRAKRLARGPLAPLAVTQAVVPAGIKCAPAVGEAFAPAPMIMRLKGRDFVEIVRQVDVAVAAAILNQLLAALRPALPIAVAHDVREELEESNTLPAARAVLP